MKLRVEDEEILVGVPSEEFDKRVRELLSESEAQELSPICERIVFWKGDLPKPTKLSSARLWFFAYLVAFGIFIYGLYSIGLKLFHLI